MTNEGESFSKFATLCYLTTTDSIATFIFGAPIPLGSLTPLDAMYFKTSSPFVIFPQIE
jgi:hypothetical protein